MTAIFWLTLGLAAVAPSLVPPQRDGRRPQPVVR